MANSYVTAADIKAAMPDTQWGPTYDALLNQLGIRASRAIDRYTGREPGAYAVTSSDETTRYFTGSGDAMLWVDELAASPSYVGLSDGGGLASSDYDTVASSDYMMWPWGSSDKGEPYMRLDLDVYGGAYSAWSSFPKSVKITAAFGYATTDNTPPEITQAALIQAVRWFKRAQQAFSDVGAIQEVGQLRYVKALDPDVAEIIRHFKRVTI